jgi:hypothetical protein
MVYIDIETWFPYLTLPERYGNTGENLLTVWESFHDRYKRSEI